MIKKYLFILLITSVIELGACLRVEKVPGLKRLCSEVIDEIRDKTAHWEQLVVRLNLADRAAVELARAQMDTLIVTLNRIENRYTAHARKLFKKDPDSPLFLYNPGRMALLLRLNAVMQVSCTLDYLLNREHTFGEDQRPHFKSAMREKRFETLQNAAFEAVQADRAFVRRYRATKME